MPTSTVHLGIFYKPQICDMEPTALLPFRRKELRGFFRLRPGLNPRTWVPEASTLTRRPPQPLTVCNYYNVSHSVFSPFMKMEKGSPSETPYIFHVKGGQHQNKMGMVLIALSHLMFNLRMCGAKPAFTHTCRCVSSLGQLTLTA
jgi:hypothetical protein